MKNVLNEMRRDFRETAHKLRSFVERKERGARDSLHLRAAAAYDLALGLQVDDLKWEAFCNDEFWLGRRGGALDRDACLRLAFLYVYGDLEGLVARQARDHARALTGCWDASKTATEAFAELQRFKFDGLKTPGADNSKRQHPEVFKALIGDDDMGLASAAGAQDKITLVVEKLGAPTRKVAFKILAIALGDVRDGNVRERRSAEAPVGRRSAEAPVGRRSAEAPVGRRASPPPTVVLARRQAEKR